MIIDNLTNNGATPKHGDIIQETHRSGAVVKKMHVDIPVPPEPAKEAVLTRYQFMCLFTNAEMVAIMTASDTDPVTRLFLKQLDNVEDVRFSDKNTIAGLAHLVSVGLITEERKEQIELMQQPE